jgi:hypothetical protein
MCTYRNILGIPNEGIHSLRICGLAAIDVLLSVLLAYFISHQMKISLYQSLLYVFISGIVLHRIFCVNTAFNVFLFGRL